ncbi:MAG TPA: hypothetical protein VM943_10690 [Pyrinomonadaceae bacterium]|nr:hypothetical protein [Pyrinomonadaceae bacterium]
MIVVNQQLIYTARAACISHRGWGIDYAHSNNRASPETLRPFMS